MRDLISLIICVVFSGLVGYMLGKEDNVENERLNAFYEQYCIALPGQTSIMRSIGDKYTCERSETLKHGNNLKDWRN